MSSCPPLSLLVQNTADVTTRAPALKNAAADAADFVTREHRPGAKTAPETSDASDKEGEKCGEPQTDRSTQAKESDTDCTQSSDVHGQLPDYRQMADPDFHWGIHNGVDFVHTIECA